MKLPTSVRYAVRILFKLHEARAPLSIASISEKTGIAMRTVELLHSTLKKNGITSGTVGAKGGISLNIPLKQISLARIIDIIDDGLDFTVCHGERTNECPTWGGECSRRDVWKEVSRRTHDLFDSIFLDYLQTGGRPQEKITIK